MREEKRKKNECGVKQRCEKRDDEQRATCVLCVLLSTHSLAAGQEKNENPKQHTTTTSFTTALHGQTNTATAHTECGSWRAKHASTNDNGSHARRAAEMNADMNRWAFG